MNHLNINYDNLAGALARSLFSEPTTEEVQACRVHIKMIIDEREIVQCETEQMTNLLHSTINLIHGSVYPVWQRRELASLLKQQLARAFNCNKTDEQAKPISEEAEYEL